MTRKIDASRLSPVLPKAWDAPENKLAPAPEDIDALLQRTVTRPAWRGASSAAMTLDPITRKPMVDPVLCNDGKLHDRTTVRAVPYLDTDMTAPRNLQVLGHDLEARAAVHESFAVARAMFTNRQEVAEQVASARSRGDAALAGSSSGASTSLQQTASASSNLETAGLSTNEHAYRNWQMRARVGMLGTNSDNLLRRPRTVPKPLSFRRNTFAALGVVPPAEGMRKWLEKAKVARPVAHLLVDHLVQHKVFLGQSQDTRTLGCMENLEAALTSFRYQGRSLDDEEKGKARKCLQFFERLTRDSWKAVAEVEYSRALLHRNTQAVQQNSHAYAAREVQSMAYTSQYLAMQTRSLLSVLHRTDDASRGKSVPARFQTVPAPRRTRSLQDLRLSDDPAQLDEDVFYCPLLLEPAPAPVLCSDGHSYDLSQLLEGQLTVSPLTREPLQIIGRHDEKQRYATHFVGKQDVSYFQETYEGLLGAYKPKVGGFEDQLVNYQRRRRLMSRQARPDSVSMNVFHKFAGLSKSRSAALVTELGRQGILNRNLDRRIVPNLSKAKVREALGKIFLNFDKMRLTQKTDLVRVMNTLYEEQQRRFPLVAQAHLVTEQLALAPKHTPRHAELEAELVRIKQELRKLPSGAQSEGSLPLY